MNTDPMENMKEHVLTRIRAGDVRMRPRLFFILRFAAVAAAAVAVLLLSAFILSFIFFSLSEGGEHFLLSFGSRGIVTFLALFPWTLLAVDIVAALVLWLLLHDVKPMYRFSFATIIGGIGAASIALALLINLTPLHAALLERADADDLPVLDFFYEDIRSPDESQGEFRGTIRAIDGRTVIIMHDDHDEDTDDRERTVDLPESVDASTFEVGDEIYVAGEEDNDDTVRAYGARELHDAEEREEDN